MKKSPRRRELGRHVVTDPDICHGELTFKGTRIFVKHVLEQVANGMNRDEIVAAWDGAVTEEAIAEAIQLASDALISGSARIRYTPRAFCGMPSRRKEAHLPVRARKPAVKLPFVADSTATHSGRN